MQPLESIRSMQLALPIFKKERKEKEKGGPIRCNRTRSHARAASPLFAVTARLASQIFLSSLTGLPSSAASSVALVGPGESLGTRHLSPYMKPLGSDYANGVNFAVAGATATAGGTPFSLDVQVDQFLFFKDRCLELIDRGALSRPLLSSVRTSSTPFFTCSWVFFFVAQVRPPQLMSRASPRLSTPWILAITTSTGSSTCPMTQCSRSFPA
jgi:hypothetical protein